MYLRKGLSSLDTVLISAYAKLPANTAAEEVYKVLALAVLVDLDSGTIVQADCSMVTQLARSYVSQLLVGYDLNGGAEGLLARFQRRYHGAAKKALETALKSICKKYEELRQG